MQAWLIVLVSSGSSNMKKEKEGKEERDLYSN